MTYRRALGQAAAAAVRSIGVAELSKKRPHVRGAVGLAHSGNPDGRRQPALHHEDCRVPASTASTPSSVRSQRDGRRRQARRSPTSSRTSRSKRQPRSSDDARELRIAVDQLARVVAGQRLPSDASAGSVGDRLRREVIVQIQQARAGRLRGALRGLRERLELLRRIEVVVPIFRRVVLPPLRGVSSVQPDVGET